MGLIIGCPYYISDKRRSITCEGRLKCFADKERKDGHMKNICEKNYITCKYYKGLQKLYESCSDLSQAEATVKLQKYYLDENRKTIKHLIQQLGIQEKNVTHNIAVKQAEIDKLQSALKASKAREGVALLELAAIMHENGIDTVDFGRIEAFQTQYIATFEDADSEGRTARLVVREREG